MSRYDLATAGTPWALIVLNNITGCTSTQHSLNTDDRAYVHGDILVAEL